MAILKNLVVNGSSRFLNKAYFQDVQIGGNATLSSLSLSGNLSVTGTSTFTGAATFSNTVNATGNITSSGNLYANGGYLYLQNKIAADGGKTTANQLTINGSNAFTIGTYIKNNLKTDTLNATNVNVSNNLHATHFDLQTVAQLGGSFYVSPTLKFPNSGATLGVTKSGSTLTLTITDSSITSATLAGIVWTVGSSVKVSGNINGVVTGTMDGTITGINPGSNSGTLTISCSGENSGSVVAGSYSASQFSDLSVMVYQRKDSSNDYRVGIWMNCYDLTNSSATIRVYGGTSASPNVMLGNLTNAGLGTVNNITPNGWGLYAQNVFLWGAIVSTEGQIGGFTIGDSTLSNGTFAQSGGVFMSTGKTASNVIGGSSGSNTWAFTAGNTFGVTTAGKIYASDAKISGDITATSGTIGGVTANKSYGLYTNSKTSATSTNTGFLISKDGAIYLGAYNSTNQACPFQVTSAGVLTATSGKIGGWNIGVSAIYSDSHTAWNSNNNGVYIGTSGIAGGAGGEWWFWNDGSAKIGAMTLSASGVLEVPAANITGTLTASQIGANQITAEKLSVTVGGNNLLRNSHQSISNGNYAFGDWYFGPNPPKEGEQVTFQLKGQLASTKTEFRVYNSGGSVSPDGNILSYNSTTGIYSATFNWKVGSASNTYLRVYAFTNSQSGTSSCEWAKLEYGDVATPWSPSPDEAGGFDIDNTSIHTANVVVTSNADNSIALSSADFTRTINGTSRAGLRFAMGDKFGVTGDGIIYASSVDLTGKITATSGTIGGCSITNGALDVPAANITGSFSVGKIDGLSDSLSNIENTANAALGQSVWYATCSTAAATTAKVATISPTTTNFTLKAGAVVNVSFTNTNSGAVGSITLNVNNTGAKNIKYINNNSITNIPGVGYILANRTYQFVYDGTYWVIQNLNTYTDTINRTKYDIVIRANGTITAGHIICGTSNGYVDIGASVSFDLSYPLLYAATGLSTGGTGSNNFLQINDINASNNGTIVGGAAYKTLYLKGKVSSNTFTISSSEYLTATPPSNIDNLYYIPLGTFKSGSTTNIYFNSSSRLYAYINGTFQPVDMAVRRYITDISSGGIKVSYATDPINYLQIVPSGINIFKNNNQIASYGSSIILGELADGKTHVEIDSDSFDVCLGATTGANSTKLATFGETVVLGANNDAQLSINESEIIMTNNYFNANDYFGSADIFTVKTTIPDVRTYEAAGLVFEYYPPDEVFDTQKATIEIQGNYIKGVGQDVYLVLLDKTNNWAEYSRVKLSSNYYTSGYNTSKAYVIINDDGINFINNTMSQAVAEHAYIDFAHIAFNVTLQDTPLTTMNIIGDLNVSGRFDENTVTTIGGRITCEEIANGDGTTLGAISHIGSIIMSTTLRTMDEVIAIYGGEYWIQHSGYFLYGATSGVTADFNTKDGGYDSVKLTAAQSGVGTHHHGTGDNSYKYWTVLTGGASQETIGSISGTGYKIQQVTSSYNYGTRAVTNDVSAGASSAHTNMPPFKNVYIWERTA